MLARIVGAVAISAAAVFAVPAAIASADEASYLNDLEGAGFVGGAAGGAEALYWGYAACNDSARGMPLETQIRNVWLQTNSSISMSDAQYLVESAHIYLC